MIHNETLGLWAGNEANRKLLEFRARTLMLKHLNIKQKF